MTKHRPNSAFSKNSEKIVYTYGDGSYKTQSVLNGKYTTYDKNGKKKR